ncbi:MAG TPA: acyltransferase, partial [Alphaproteobacteria bacterium]
LLLRSMLAYSNEWNPAGWTLPFELWAYFTLPFAALAVFTRSYWLKILGAICAATVFWLHYHFYSHVLYLVGEFCLGVAMYILYRRYGFPMLRLPLRLTILAASTLIVIIFAALDAVYDINILLVRALGCLGIFLMFLNSEPMVRSMRDLPVVKGLLTLGQYSYSLYLWHFGVLEISLVYMIGHFQAQTLGEMALLIFISIPLVLLFTWLSYHVIEKNARMSRILKGVVRLRTYKPA